MIPQHSIDAASGVRLIGGEVMSHDMPRVTRSGAVAYLVHRLLARSTDRVLLVGPKAAALLDVIDPSRPVDVVLRSLPDAREIAGRSAAYAHLRLFCGGVERFAPTQAYALVVCLDDPETLLTPDSTPRGQHEVLGLIGGWACEQGQAVVGLSNALGLDEVFRLDLRTMFDTDHAWHRGSTGYDRRHLVFPEVEESVTEAGLRTTQLYCGYPSRDTMSLLVAPEIADTAAGRAHLQTLLTRTATATTRPALTDVSAIARQYVEAGIVGQTAPGWLIVASPDGTEIPQLPEILLSEDGRAPQWEAVMTTTRDEIGLRRRVVSLGTGEMIERRVSRDLSAIDEEPPEGALLESRLRLECEQGNVAELRRLVTMYAAFLADDSLSTSSRTRFFALPSNVVVTPQDELAVLDRSWSWAEDVPADLALTRGLRDFARRLLSAGAEHPWQPETTPDAMTQTLLAMVGRSLPSSTVFEIAQREAELHVVLHGGGPVAESELLAENLAQGSSQAVVLAPSRGYRETLSSVGRMSQALHERGNQVTWLETSLRERDRRVADLQRQLERIKTSPSYLLGRRMTSPGRQVSDRIKARGKSTVLSLLPPRYLARAERAFDRAGI